MSYLPALGVANAKLAEGDSQGALAAYLQVARLDRVASWSGLGLALEGHDFPGLRLLDQGTAQLIVERMPGLHAAELANHAVSQLVQVADGIQYLVLDEFVVVTETVLVEDALKTLATESEGRIVGLSKQPIT